MDGWMDGASVIDFSSSSIRCIVLGESLTTCFQSKVAVPPLLPRHRRIHYELLESTKCVEWLLFPIQLVACSVHIRVYNNSKQKFTVKYVSISNENGSIILSYHYLGFAAAQATTTTFIGGFRDTRQALFDILIPIQIPRLLSICRPFIPPFPRRLYFLFRSNLTDDIGCLLGSLRWNEDCS